MKFATESIDEQFATLTREQAARALGISTDTLDALHARDEGPPRFRASPRRWAYPAAEFRRWQERRLTADA
jgi:predicted DNA-binding transcriptional regulator AlpA